MTAPAVRSLGAYTIDRRPLAVPAYRRLWTASAVSAVGGSFSVVAVPAQLFTVTGSSAAVGAAGAVSLVALVGSALWSGALADLMDRRRLLLAAHCGLALTYVALWGQAVLGGGSVPALLALVACQGLTLGAIMTTMGAVVPRVVPAELLAAAGSLSSLTRYAGSVLGPMLAGVLIPVAGLGTLFLLDAVALLAVVWAVAKLPALPPEPHPPAPLTDRSAPRPPAPPTDRSAPCPPAPPTDRSAPCPPAPPAVQGAATASLTGQESRPEPRPARRRPTLGQLRDGFRYLAGSRLLVAVLAVDLAAMVFGMPTALYPELARHVFGGPEGGGPELGLLYAAYPAGVIAAGLFSGTFTRARRHGALMAAAAAAWGAALVLLGLAAHLWLALAALVLGGAVNFVLSTFRNAITQAHTHDAMRGRIQGSVTVVLFGGPHLANLLHGATASLLDARLVICAGGLLTTATVAVIAWMTPELRDYRP
ncbi:MFS transporter [Nonomuraea candida]|uniref:MFS transporter n=1 Tax=Nonomuraea candida TaxID=359159 RepID=UPI0006932080|nr:MFS transporter [Nonomuraea candida]